METIELDFLRQQSQEIDFVPEAQLILAIMKQAWSDASKRFDCPIKVEARQWFFSNPFENYCDLLNIDASMIQNSVLKYWKSLD